MSQAGRAELAESAGVEGATARALLEVEEETCVSRSALVMILEGLTDVCLRSRALRAASATDWLCDGSWACVGATENKASEATDPSHILCITSSQSATYGAGQFLVAEMMISGGRLALE